MFHRLRSEASLNYRLLIVVKNFEEMDFVRTGRRNMANSWNWVHGRSRKKRQGHYAWMSIRFPVRQVAFSIRPEEP
jgi:hypothetical protein